MARTDKLSKLVTVFDHFHSLIARLDDPIAKRLVENWAGVRQQYVTLVGVSRSTLASGMEQGLREMTILVQSMPPEARRRAVLALAEAISAHHAGFLAKDAERLAKIKARGFIRSENEYYLIRHQVDLLEVEPTREHELRVLYELVGGFEGQGG